MLVAFMTLGAFVASGPARYAQLADPTEEVRSGLAKVGLGAAAYAFYNVTLDTVFVSVFAVVAIVIFWHRSEDSMALLVATMLVVWGPLRGFLVQVDALHAELVGVVRGTMQPVHLSLWLRPEPLDASSKGERAE